MVYALVSTLFTAWFAWLVTNQYRQRRRPYQGVWAVSLWMAAAASFAYAACIALGGSALFFRFYYLLGALLMAAYLGVGSVYLGFSERAGRLCLAAVTAAGAVGAAYVLTAPIDAGALAVLRGGSGRGILQLTGAGRAVLISMNVFGTLAVTGVAVKSAVRLLRRREAPGWALGNLLIAAGVLVIGAAGGAAGAGREGDLFWPLMTVGWAVTFIGFRTINRAKTASALPGRGRAEEV